MSRVPDLPRSVDTLGGVISYLAVSQLSRDCEEMEFLSVEARRSALEARGKRWCFGSFVAGDGVRRTMIEEDGEGYADAPAWEGKAEDESDDERGY